MTKIRNNPLLQGASGKLGNTVIFKQWQGQVIMANIPAKRRFTSEAQKKNNAKFQDANRYAEKVMKLPKEKAEYAKGIAPNKNCAHRVAVVDFLNVPVVHYVKANQYSGAIGDVITIKATDDFKVTAVGVYITNSAGVLLEKGEAVQSPRKRHMWKYITAVANENVHGTRINVIAFDKPGHKGLGELVVANREG